MAVEKTCILNVDDYPPGLYARTRILRQAGFDVLEATSGRETLKLASEHLPAVILLDVNLPDIHGFEVCKRVRENPTLATTTILHISASSIQDQEQARGLNTGADGYLIEPIDPMVLLATIKAFLRARNAESALRRSNEDLERFAYRVSHELNEPLRTISMYSQLLENGLAGKIGPEEQQCLDFVQGGAKRMRAFIDDLLRFSQATHAGATVGLIDMEGVFSDAIRTLGAAIQESNATVTHSPLPSVIADSRIEHVLQNLIGNAIKYRLRFMFPRLLKRITGASKFEITEWASNRNISNPYFRSSNACMVLTFRVAESAWRSRRGLSKPTAGPCGWSRNLVPDPRSTSPFGNARSISRLFRLAVSATAGRFNSQHVAGGHFESRFAGDCAPALPSKQDVFSWCAGTSAL